MSAYISLEGNKELPRVGDDGKRPTPSTAAPIAVNRFTPESRARRGEGVNAMKYLFLLVPCIVAVWVPLFNFAEPALFGIPFFYWFQLLLVPVSALAIVLADRAGKA
jgi:hypothetical protein